MLTFGQQDTYRISNLKNDGKFNIDYKVLVRLYLPIIGSDAMSLYLLLESEKSLNKGTRKNNNIARLYKLLQVDEKSFDEAMDKLKQYGLVKYSARRNTANDYLFKMIPTKAATEFFEDKKLDDALLAVVDNNYYQQVKDYFIMSSIDEDDYVDIDDNSYSAVSTDEQFYENFYEKYQIIAVCNPITDLDKKEIARIKKLFKFDYETIEKIMLASFESTDNGMILDKVKLNNAATQIYNERQEALNPDQKIIKQFESFKPIRYFELKSKRSALLPSEIKMIDYILDTYKITDGVLNVVIDYYFSKGNVMGNPQNYLIKVIEDMIRNDVKTTLEAMNFLRNKNKKVKEYYQQKETTTKVESNKEPVNKVQENVDQAALDKFLKMMEED